MSRSAAIRTAHFLFVRFAWWILQTSEITLIRISIIPMMTFAFKEICITPGKEISREAIYTPPFRLRGMTGNRPFTVHRLWPRTVGFHFFIIPRIDCFVNSLLGINWYSGVFCEIYEHICCLGLNKSSDVWYNMFSDCVADACGARDRGAPVGAPFSILWF